ncbi:MAG: Metal dependent phosphohydrolase [Cenarchaeum symbiont of Oopsacas minuta]|nr:Metal dependent phosphohydrolase [Cenarchaeum symbiont of Oopsacas minuta]
MDTLDIIDPIHGFVRAFDVEQKLINDPAFQRLRRIRQLSSTYLVYPGAQHTRFEHSLGVMHIADMAGHALVNKGAIDSDRIKILRLAGLLHDIGHGPFSHMFETLDFGDGASHEEMGKKIIETTGIADTISSTGYDPKDVTSIAFGDKQANRHMTEILSGYLSADMMDYLLRDGYFTGVEHGKLDHRRITDSLDISNDRLALEKSALHSFESMMHSRYQMFKAVYFHKTVRAAEVMLAEAVRLSSHRLDLDSLEISEYLELTDEALLYRILSMDADTMDLSKAKSYAKDYQSRRLFKCVYEQLGDTTGGIPATEIRADIAKKAKVDEDQVFVDIPMAPAIPVTTFSEEEQSMILVSRGSDGSKNSQTLGISEIPLVSALSKFLNITRVYTTHKAYGNVEIIVDSALGGETILEKKNSNKDIR